jgi:hypothetical protein
MWWQDGLSPWIVPARHVIMPQGSSQFSDRRSLGAQQAAIWILGILGLAQVGIFLFMAGNGRPGDRSVTPEVEPPMAPAPEVAAGVPQMRLPGAESLPEAAPQPPPELFPEKPEHELITEEDFRRTTPALIEEQLEQARELRFEGDNFNALLRLREALLMEPRHPLVLAETAGTYEKMEDPEQARVFWKKLYDLGESAGVLRELARMRLSGQAGAEFFGDALPGEGLGGPGREGPQRFHAKPGAPIYFTDITEERNQGPEGDTFITLRLEVAARPGVEVRPRLVYVLVLFYEILNGRDIVTTNARVEHHWVSLPANWAGPDRAEILEVDYHLPAAITAEPGGDARAYHGYIARMYYDDRLADFAGEPASLLNQFPPSSTPPQTE